MKFKYSVDDIIYLKSYDEVELHLGISERTWEVISKVPLTMTYISGKYNTCYAFCEQDNFEYAIKLDAIMSIENRILPDVTNMI